MLLKMVDFFFSLFITEDLKNNFLVYAKNYVLGNYKSVCWAPLLTCSYLIDDMVTETSCKYNTSSKC